MFNNLFSSLVWSAHGAPVRPTIQRGEAVAVTVNGFTVAAVVLIASTSDYGADGSRTVGALVKFSLWSAARRRWVTVRTVVPFADVVPLAAAA